MSLTSMRKHRPAVTLTFRTIVLLTLIAVVVSLSDFCILQSVAQEGQAAAKQKNQQSLKPSQINVSYGPHPRNVLDFYRAESNEPTPLIIFIHGGGFVGGDKSSVPLPLVRYAHQSKISVASIHYRFVNGKDILFPLPQHDGARVVQFFRSQPKEWNIDPNRIACCGGSAGAGISMWIGFHDDLADPGSDDPVLQQSTRIQAVGTLGGQSTYDPIEIKKLIGGRAWEHPSLLKVYGLKNLNEALNPKREMQKLFDESSAITHLTTDDPPLYMIYSEADGPLPADAKPGDGIHHPNFGRHLKEKMDQLKIENVFIHPQNIKGVDVAKEMVGFFKKQFAKPTDVRK